MRDIENSFDEWKTKYSKLQFKNFIYPVIQKIIKKHNNKTLIVGIGGGQGTGKSTLVSFLKEFLSKLGYKVETFSIDDFYENYETRVKLSKIYKDNIFYQIPRGMPGTHKINVLLDTLKKIKSGQNFEIPVFNKWEHNAWGDVSNKPKTVNSKQDIILFEGWCLGIPYVTPDVFLDICKKNNINLKKIDPKLENFKVVLLYTKKYQQLWKFIDYFIMLKPNSSELHKKWRFEKEKKMKLEKGSGMSEEEIDNYVSTFLPCTYLCYDKSTPDLLLLINSNHEFYKITELNGLNIKIK